MEIKVFINQNAEKPIFCRIIHLNDGISMDYSLLIRSMRILFGNDCVVTFKVFEL